MIPMTPRGLGRLQKELQSLMTIERPAVSEEIARARQYGDLSENAEYHAAREKQRHIEDRIRQLEYKINNASVIDVASLSGPKIVFGAIVTLYDEDKKESTTYQIVGIDEADLAQKKIAIDSALSRELIGKEEGAHIELATPRGEKHYTIEKVEYKAHFGDDTAPFA
jgi:transcription elongation factor GreA